MLWPDSLVVSDPDFEAKRLRDRMPLGAIRHTNSSYTTFSSTPLETMVASEINKNRKSLNEYIMQMFLYDE